MLASKSNRISNFRKGPRIVASCKSRSVYARRTVAKSSAKTVNSSSTSDTTSESVSESGTTLEDEDAEEDNEYQQNDGEEKIPEESIDDSVSVTTSVDIIPSSDVVRRIVPPIRPSYFPNVPPYVNFCLHDERTETLPKEIQKHLKWRLSPITPLVVKNTLSNSGNSSSYKVMNWEKQSHFN